jgi:hypothetical protein
MIAIAFWNRVKFSMLYYCLKIGSLTYHIISLLLPIVFADHLLFEKKEKEGAIFVAADFSSISLAIHVSSTSLFIPAVCFV